MSTNTNNNPKPPKYVVRRYKLSASINKTKTNGSDLDDGGSSSSSTSSTLSPPPTTTTPLGLPTIQEVEEPMHEGSVHESSAYVHQGPIFIHEDDQKQSSSPSSLSTTNTTDPIIHHPVHEDLSLTGTSTGTNADEPNNTANSNTDNTNNKCNMTSAFILMEQHGIDIDTVTNDQWDEIMWYQVAVVRKQRREKQRGGHQTHCGEIFSRGSEEGCEEKVEGSVDEKR